jgi:hypothetical protein
MLKHAIVIMVVHAISVSKAYKALRVNGDDSPYYPRLLAASVIKPTLHIKRLRFAGHSPNNIKLNTASIIPCPEQLKREREKAEKAMSLKNTL